MARETGVEWTNGTWPVVQGCDYDSPGCIHCYAVGLIWRQMHHPNAKISAPVQGLVEKRNSKLVWTGKVALRDDRLGWPASWREPPKIFIPSHGDLFHPAVPDTFIDRTFDVMEEIDRHSYQLLTKRSRRMRDYVRRRYVKDGFWRAPPAHIWLGVSAEDQKRADERVADLVGTPAHVRFLSCEPLLESIDLTRWMPPGRAHYVCQKCWAMTNNRHFNTCRYCGAEGYLTGSYHGDSGNGQPISQVIVGGESGPQRRPTNIDAHRSLRDQCQRAGVAFFEKQIDKVIPIPEDLMIRQFPEVRV